MVYARFHIVSWATLSDHDLKKWPFAHLCAYRIWSKRRTTTPFALGNRYDHRETRKHKFHVMGSYKKFLEGFEVAVATLWNSPFEVTGRGRKRCLSMIFEKWPFAYLCAHRIWSKCRTTTPFALGDRYNHEEACKHKFHVMGSYRNFLELSEVTFATFSTPQTLLLPLMTSKRELHKVATAISERSKKFSVASHDMKFVFASCLIIISISDFW